MVISDLKWIEMQIERARSMSPGKFTHDKTRPNCFLKLVLAACPISVQKKYLLYSLDTPFHLFFIASVNIKFNTL